MNNISGVTFNIGSTGVDLFFIISGFVIYKSIDSNTEYLKFIKSRFLRLFPIYWVVITFTFVLIRLGWYMNLPIEIRSFKDYFFNLTMFQHFFHIENLDGPYWTLIIELNFYFVILCLLRIKEKIPMLFFLMSLLLLFVESIIDNSNIYYDAFSYYFPLFRWAPLFTSGIIFYKIFKKEINEKYGFLMIVLCFGIQVFLFYKFHSKAIVSFISFDQHFWSLLIYFLLFTLLVSNKLHFIVNKATLFLGSISYPMYLVHQFVSVSIIIPFFHSELGINYYISSLVICLPIIILLSFLFHKYLEIRLVNAIKRKLNF